ncbi:HAMP domain-containing sensor histidine kinase [Catenulispora subtropica]|uniref:histidine kinase n=1 Tax=Catenulispora subtropica TaxID=450798 RepID=A0ABP5CHI0_9ACTN
MRRLPLRGRLALLSAVAVTVAIAAVSLISWFAVRDGLNSQLDKSIQRSTVPEQFFHIGQETQPADGYRILFTSDPCTPPPQLPGLGPGGPPGHFAQVPETSLTFVGADGTRCATPGSTQVLDQPSDLELVGQPSQAHRWRDGVDVNGQKVRVEVVPAPMDKGVFLKSQSRQSVDDSLTSLAWLLFVVSVLGVGGAATAGLLVARAALRPVDQLTEAVEHVARTEDLSVRMPVTGEDEIARLSESFNAMTAALQASRDEQKRLVDDAGHELRTPLTSLRTTIDLLIRSEESGRPLPKRTELLTGARTQMRELTVLIADLLELSRPEQAAPAASSPVALHEVVENAVERVRPRGAARETPVTITAAIEPWYTHGDAAALERAIVNLLDNAVKFSPPGSEVDVRLAEGELTVRDRGPGVPPEELPHVFERFWRSPSARALPGSGLGLAIAARAVREAGGTVTLEAPPDGVGAVARLRLPGAGAA